MFYREVILQGGYFTGRLREVEGGLFYREDYFTGSIREVEGGLFYRRLWG